MREAALYARVSTRKQEEEATIESQLDQLQRYVKEHELSVSEVHQYIDQAVSGKRLARPGLDRMRDAVMAGEFGVLLCLSPDRLARNLGAQQVILDELERYGVEVVFINQPQSSDEPQGKLLLGIQGVFAEYERTVINERMRRGRLYRLRQGQSVTNLAPYGYRYQASDRHHSNAWITVPEEAALVRQIFVDYTTLHLSLGQLQMRINAQNIPSPKGGQWTVSTLGRVLRQPAYKGTACYNYHQLDESTVGKPRRQGPGYLHFPRYKPRPVEDWIWFQVPPLVDEALWEAAQERLAMQSRYAPRNARTPYLLRGLLVCGVCGFTLQARTQKDSVTYYCRHGGRHCPEGVAQHTCSVRAEAIEVLVWQSLADLLDHPQQIQEAWQTLQSEQTTEGEYQRLQQRYTILDKQRQRLIDAYQADLITLDELRQRQNPLDNQLQSIRANLTSFSQPKPQIVLSEFTEAIQRALSSCDFDTRQEVIRLLIERIVVTNEALTIEHVIPTMTNSRLSLVDHAK